jgi:hypothetical protein
MMWPTRMSPLGPLPPAPRHDADKAAPRLYTVLVFDDLVPAPWVVLVEADNDTKAIAIARSLHPTKRRELWHRHRLVAEIS